MEKVQQGTRTGAMEPRTVWAHPDHGVGGRGWEGPLWDLKEEKELAVQPPCPCEAHGV